MPPASALPPRTKRGLRNAATGLLLLLCTACASTPESSPERDQAGKRFEAVPGAAVIYVYNDVRGAEYTDTALLADGKVIGQTVPGTYFRLILFPGRHQITAMSSGPGMLEIDTRDGEVYFVAIDVSGNFYTSPIAQFRLVAPEAGKAAIVRCCNRLETWQAGQPRLVW